MQQAVVGGTVVVAESVVQGGVAGVGPDGLRRGRWGSLEGSLVEWGVGQMGIAAQNIGSRHVGWVGSG